MKKGEIGRYKREKLSLTNLVLDIENFRTGKVESQSDAISVLINRNANKLKGLAQSIMLNGFIDLDAPCVFPDPTSTGKYIVAEGNRRIATLKILKAPTLAKNTDLLSDVQRLKRNSDRKLPAKIECAVFEDKRGCLAYMLMRHGLGTDGAGVIQWNSIAKLRADEFVNGTVHQQLRVLDFVTKNGSLTQDRQRFIDDDEVKITNLSRLTADPTVRNLLGITNSDCTESSNGHAWLLEVWQRVVEVIIDGVHKGSKFTVDTNINSIAQRVQFINEIIAQNLNTVADPQSSQPAKLGGTKSEPVDAEDPNPTTGTSSTPDPKTKGKSAQSTQTRKVLIPKSFNPPKLAPQKAINICLELKTLDIQKYSHSVGVMFRVFVELGIDYYLSKNPSVRPKKDELKSKITAVSDHFEASSVLSKKQLKPIRDSQSQSFNPISTETMNAYVHNQNVSPNPIDLKVSWDNIEPFVKMLWSV
jgi:hypothetical protein